MQNVTLEQATRAGNRLGVNWDVISPRTLQKGMKVEREHTDITHNNLTMCARIALAHLSEFPDYYEALEVMERKLKRRWKGRRIPDIYL